MKIKFNSYGVLEHRKLGADSENFNSPDSIEKFQKIMKIGSLRSQFLFRLLYLIVQFNGHSDEKKCFL